MDVVLILDVGRVVPCQIFVRRHEPDFAAVADAEDIDQAGDDTGYHD